jgi:catechol 2,3-dioxygenase-like lactoylglutathione lyase family enzyme
MLMELAYPQPAGPGPGLSAVVNCRDMEAQKRWYRDTLGLTATLDSSWWVQLAAGEAGLGLHPRAGSAKTEGHHGRAITIGLAVPDLADWHEESAARGVAFAAPPADRGFGAFVDASDPDGNPVTFREAPEPETLEEQLAEPFEDEGAPRRTAMRKPISKRAKATSRVAARPEYRAAKPAKQRRRVTKSVARVVSPRGTGPAGTRKKPKRKHDPKRARTKPATGRRKKAERRTFKSKKQAIASASRRKPVKRASRARTKKRVVTRGRTAKR